MEPLLQKSILKKKLKIIFQALINSTINAATESNAAEVKEFYYSLK